MGELDPVSPLVGVQRKCWSHSLRTEFSEYLPAFSIATQQVADRQELSQSFKWSRRRKRKQREKMCVRFTLIIANCLLALLGLLLLAGGVWRIVDDGSLREVAKEIRDTQEWDEVKKGVDGLEEAVKEAASHKYL